MATPLFLAVYERHFHQVEVGDGGEVVVLEAQVPHRSVQSTMPITTSAVSRLHARRRGAHADQGLRAVGP